MGLKKNGFRGKVNAERWVFKTFMAQGLFRYDPETKEFRARETSRPWVVEEDGGVTILDPGGSDQVVSDLPVDASPEVGSEGWPNANPMPIGRGRRQAFAPGSRIETAVYGRGWRIALWVLIALMTMTWVGMIFNYVYEPDSTPQEDPFDFFSDEFAEG